MVNDGLDAYFAVLGSQAFAMKFAKRLVMRTNPALILFRAKTQWDRKNAKKIEEAANPKRQNKINCDLCSLCVLCEIRNRPTRIDGHQPLMDGHLEVGLALAEIFKYSLPDAGGIKELSPGLSEATQSPTDTRGSGSRKIRGGVCEQSNLLLCRTLHR